MNRKKYTRSQIVFYSLSLLIIFSMILGMVAVAITPY